MTLPVWIIELFHEVSLQGPYQRLALVLTGKVKGRSSKCDYLSPLCIYYKCVHRVPSTGLTAMWC